MQLWAFSCHILLLCLVNFVHLVELLTWKSTQGFTHLRSSADPITQSNSTHLLPLSSDVYPENFRKCSCPGLKKKKNGLEDYCPYPLLLHISLISCHLIHHLELSDLAPFWFPDDTRICRHQLFKSRPLEVYQDFYISLGALRFFYLLNFFVVLLIPCHKISLLKFHMRFFFSFIGFFCWHQNTSSQGR